MLTLLIMKEKEKEKMKININKILKYLCYFKKLVIQIILGYSRKKIKQRRLSMYFFFRNQSPYPGFFRFVTSSLEIPEKTSFHPYKFWKTVWHPWKFQVIFITRMPVFLLLPFENECLQAFSTINADNNEEFTIKHGEKNFM